MSLISLVMFFFNFFFFIKAVHNAILDDLDYPAEIVGKRIR